MDQVVHIYKANNIKQQTVKFNLNDVANHNLTNNMSLNAFFKKGKISGDGGRGGRLGRFQKVYSQ